MRSSDQKNFNTDFQRIMGLRGFGFENYLANLPVVVRANS